MSKAVASKEVVPSMYQVPMQTADLGGGTRLFAQLEEDGLVNVPLQFTARGPSQRRGLGRRDSRPRGRVSGAGSRKRCRGATLMEWMVEGTQLRFWGTHSPVVPRKSYHGAVRSWGPLGQFILFRSW
ncbi:UNVERIFIED_CONTAM: hypothetical protein Sradi_0712600 [Sesamum radiatum]|uniref:Uncharacterized protein n=1 Tax=Sesamum radiatum TaxID=300843 RepID=A0AAW2VP19_SESRA